MHQGNARQKTTKQNFLPRCRYPSQIAGNDERVIFLSLSTNKKSVYGIWHYPDELLSYQETLSFFRSMGHNTCSTPGKEPMNCETELAIILHKLCNPN